MRFQHSVRSASLLMALPLALAQTSTTCNPLTATCPSDAGLSSSSLTTDFTSSGYSNWSPASGFTQGSNGIEFTITADGQAPTLTSDFYIFFGRVDVVMQAAPGVGIVSSIVLESDDLDEIDWEFLGGDTTQGQTNFFGKGNTTSYDRGGFATVSTPQTTFHTYSVIWTSAQIEWLVDDVVVRTLLYTSSLAEDGAQYPQTPARVKLGDWVGGGAEDAAGTVEWAGGETDFSLAPFTMYVKSVSITNYNPAASYTYGDHTGDWQSIEASNSSVVSTSSTTASVSSTTVVTSTSSHTPATSSTVSLTSTLSLAVEPVSSTFTTSIITTSDSSSGTASASLVTSSPASSGSVSSSMTSSSTASATTADVVKSTSNSASSVKIGAASSLLGLAAVLFMI